MLAAVAQIEQPSFPPSQVVLLASVEVKTDPLNQLTHQLAATAIVVDLTQVIS
jgi:hypothetical protein